MQITEQCDTGLAACAGEPHKSRAPIQSSFGRRIDHPRRVLP